MNLRFKVFKNLRGRLYPDTAELGDMPVVLLVYLIFLFMPWMVGAPGSMPMTLLSIALYLPLHFLQWRSQRLLPIIVGMWLIWFVFSGYNWGTNTYVIYACAVAGSIVNGRHALLAVAALLGAMCYVLRLRGAPTEAYLAPCVMAVIVFVGARAQRESMRTQAFLRLGQHEISKLAERNERDRIARDVHDLLGHSLTLISLKADLALKLIAIDPDAAQVELQHIRDAARESLVEVRQAVHGMRSAQISVELSKSKLACEAANIRLHADLQDGVVLPRATEDVLASVLREAINNAIRHAKANNVYIGLQQQRNAVRLTVRDDGRSRNFREGHGLSAMRDRVKEAGGEISLSSEKGFLVDVSLVVQGETPAKAGLSPADAFAKANEWPQSA
jgi:two-component system, NarL family, sensor histidine kinase DesK